MKELNEMNTVGLRLRGSRENLERVIEKFTRDREIELLPWRPDGGWPVPLAKIAGEKLLAKYVDLGKRFKRLEGINGGEVVSHFHLGNDVILLERDVFVVLCMPPSSLARIVLDLPDPLGSIELPARTSAVTWLGHEILRLTGAANAA